MEGAAVNRRGFLRGAISVMAVAAILKGRMLDDGIALNSIAHPNNPFGLAPVKYEGGVIAYDVGHDERSVLTEWRLTDKNQWYLTREVITKC